MLKEIFDWRKELQGRSPKWHAWFISHIGVPGALLAYLLSSGFTTVSPYRAFEDSISVLELKSSWAESVGTADDEATLLMVDPVDQRFSITWNGGGKEPLRMQSSMERSLAVANQSNRRIQLDNEGGYFEMPFLGVGQPVAILVNRSAGDELLFPGKKGNIETFAPSSRQSVSTVLTSVIFCMFSIGYSLGFSVPPNEQKDRSREHSGEKDKH